MPAAADKSRYRTSLAGLVRVLAVVVVGIVVLASCTTSITNPKPDAQEIARQFASYLSESDFEAAAGLTSDPQKALETLNFTTDSLGSPSVTYSNPKATAAQVEGTVTFIVTWDFGGEQSWEYPVLGDMQKIDDNWEIVWDPALLHPDLSIDTRLVKSDEVLASPAVVDRKGQPLLTEQLVTVVRLDPKQITDPQGTAAALAAVLSPIEPSVSTESIAAEIAANTEAFTLIALRPQVAAGVAIPQLPGVSTNQQARLLTYDKAVRSVAFGELDEAWQAAYDDTKGWRITLRNPAGEVVQEYKSVAPQQPYDVSTSFDLGVQSAAQAAIDAIAGQAAIVAIQPSTGGVLAVAQNAAADAEGAISLTGQYPPGSTFKLVTTSAALSAGLAQPDTVLPCPGEATINGRTIPNDEGFDLGDVPLHTAFAQSCNTTLAALAAQLPADSLHSEALKYGLGVDYLTPYLTTITGSVPPSESDAQQVEASIGQGTVTASPFGMALAAATVVTGQTPMPMLVQGQQAQPDQDAPAPTPSVIADLTPMLLETVQSGSAAAIADIAGLGGKTGTAQYGDGTNSHGWFIGVYQDVAFAVLLVGAGSSKPAVEVAGNFIRAI